MRPEGPSSYDRESLMAKPDYPVMVPYSELMELLDVARQVKAYKAEVQKLQSQVLSLRIMQQQCFEKLQELREEL